MASKRRIMRNFVIKEISGVDSPAQVHARAAIMKREEPVADDVKARSDPGGDNRDTSEIRTKLRLGFENNRRAYPNVGDARNLGQAWLRLSRAERDAILAEEDTGEDPVFDHAELEKLDKREASILKGSIAISTIQALAELRCKADPRLTIEKARAEVRVIHRELARREREARQELT
jgi:hypothetical protein